MAAASGKQLTDCPSNLREAIDWILRVTGKDGQDQGGGQGGTQQLAEAVAGLLEGVKSSSPELDSIFQVKEALNSNPSGLIAKLAEGLQQFIGYEKSGNKGIIKHSNNGIGASNDPLERLQEGLLGFWIGMIQSLVDSAKNVAAVSLRGVSLDRELRPALGGGIGNKNFSTAVTHMMKLSEDSRKSNQITQVVTALNTVTNLQSPSQIKAFATQVSAYLGKVLEAVSTLTSSNSAVNTLKSSLPDLVTKIGTNWTDTQPIDLTRNGIGEQIKTVQSNNEKLIQNVSSLTGNQTAQALCTAVYRGTDELLWQLQKGYKSYYQGVQVNTDQWSGNKAVEAKTCAQIFLSIIPLIWSALSYLYFKCSKNDDDGWNAMTLGGGPLKDFLYSMWYDPSKVNVVKRGSDLVTLLDGKFKEFKTAATQQKFYSDFLKNFRSKGLATWRVTHQATDQNSLSGLYILCSCYFRCQQIKNADKASKNPQTIREMLYFLAAFQFSPQYDAFDSYVTEYFKTLIGNQSGNDDAALMIPVADSGISTEATEKSGGNTLSAADLKSYLASTFHLAPAFIGLIQEPSTSGEPWLHSLFSNSQFNLSIPSSGAGIFGALSNYTYALQFQLHFLYQQCSNTYTVGCGWRDCRFGKDINKGSKPQVTSHICQGYDCAGSDNCKHDGQNGSLTCKHNNKVEPTCGQGSNKSPLQAFLTDKLRRFSRIHPPDPYSHLAVCSGSMCHVPMGFESHLRDGNGLQGSHISLTLKAFCGGSKTPLRQLSEKLGCLSKRTPRTLGDLFGFIWHLNGQLFKSGVSADEALKQFLTSIGLKQSDWPQMSALAPSTFLGDVQKRIDQLMSPPTSAQTQSGIEKSLAAFSGLPFWYNLFLVKPGESLPAVLFKIKNISHQTSKDPRYTGTHNDLYSLFNSTCSQPNCGPYLYPLTHSDGATFAPTHASTYLSWVLYLSDDLQSWFQDMLDEFKNIDCSKTGCTGHNKCSQSHANGSHGEEAKCKCPSVVQCGGTLPLLYQHGFRYNNPLVLKDGWYYDGSSWKKQDSYTRKCSHFASQLNNFLQTNSPLNSLITTVDDFLYAIRWEFFSKLSAFWTIYVCIILYTFFFLLDTLRVRSHLHFPSSNSIPSISLLSTGKAPALKKFTNVTYFMP
ncbi:variant erythrocyte surface antigen-1 family protein [Babesia caballi]|uniref:Variant erythrocyte surface antigen-1 family protein n=1 Tax=Babesia caballi TaxID=5871 RepID=A0AAV4LTU4_BABCB|nr:variant erythrocyte surface antigen-1 family protein [Babesia caballi]